MIGLLTPPVGLCLYIVSDVAKISFGETVKAVLPTLIPLFIVLLAVTYLPELVLLIPRAFGLL